MADRLARPSTDEETAPLLRDPEAEENRASDAALATPTFADRVNSIAQEPLTPLTKILLTLALVLLLLSSVFIGLFAGAQHKLNSGHGGGPPLGTRTETATATETTTRTATTRTTSIGTTTKIATTITTRTTTIISGPTGVPEQKTCLKPECIVLASDIISSLDTSQDPCENFYDYANGGWLKSHPLPSDKGSFGIFEALAQQNEHVIQEILESESSITAFSGSDDKAILRKLRDFYSSCMNEERLDSIGEAPLLRFTQTLRRLYRGNSTDITFGEEEPKKNGLTAAIAFLHARGIDALFSTGIEGDVGVDPNYMMLWFSQTEFGLPSKEYYEEKSIRKIYQQVVERLLLALAKEDGDDDDDDDDVFDTSSAMPALNVNEDFETWPPWPWPPWGGEGDGDDDDGGDPDDKEPVDRKKEIHEMTKKVVKFERRLARASLDLDILLQDPVATYNPFPINNLTATITQIDFPDYFATLTPRNFPERVIITYPAYVTSVSEILDDTPSDVIENYLVARAALTLSPFLGMDTEAWRAQRTLVEALTGIKKGAVGVRAEYCVGKIEQTLGFAAGRYFVNETFGGESKKIGTKVITDIIDAFKESLSGITWMDDKSANAAAEKANAIRVKVGYPVSPDTLDPRSILNYYNRVQVDKDNFFENMLSSAASDKYQEWQQLGKQRDLNSWEMWPSMVNAYFNPPANEIVFPAGILQPPFFSQSWPRYLTYGAFGHVASHELTHAFDSAGRLYNQNGKLEEWWSNATSERFNVKQDCIVKQYSEYTIDDGRGGKIHVNGNLTSGENIGDTGLIQAYRAWQAQFQISFETGNEYLLPGLNYTREQLFFISFARIWARAMKPAAAVQRIRTDPHSPSRYRVDGTVYNIPEFAKAFKCSKKAKLNPPRDNQCIFWS